MSPWIRDDWWKGLTVSERQAVVDRVDRNCKLAVTYLRKAADFLHVKPGPPSTWYWTLLDATLAGALDIVEALPDEFFESTPTTDFLGLGSLFCAVCGVPNSEHADEMGQSLHDHEFVSGLGKHNLSDGPLEAAEKLVAALQERREASKVRRKIELLEDHTGRTPEEAAAFQAKATELRSRRTP